MSAQTSSQSLEDLIQKAGNPVQMLRNSQDGAYVYPVVPTEFKTGVTNLAMAEDSFFSTSRTTWWTYILRAPTPENSCQISPSTASKTSPWTERSNSFRAATAAT